MNLIIKNCLIFFFISFNLWRCRYSISLLVWVYTEGRNGEIISYWKDSIYGVSLSLENFRPVFHVYSRDLLTKHSLQGPNSLTHHVWYHLSGLYDYNTGRAALLVNGSVVANDTIESFELKTEYGLWLGFLFKGRLSHIWIFNVSLTVPNVNHFKDINKVSSKWFIYQELKML